LIFLFYQKTAILAIFSCSPIKAIAVLLYCLAKSYPSRPKGRGSPKAAIQEMALKKLALSWRSRMPSFLVLFFSTPA